MKMSQITLVLFLTIMSIIGMSFGTVVIFPKGNLINNQVHLQQITHDTFPPEEPIEEYQDTVSIDEDNLPIGVPAMNQGEVESIECNNEDELDSYKIKYKDLSNDAMEEYIGILEKAGFDIEDTSASDNGSMLTAQDGFVSIVVMFNDDAATINADLM